MGHPLQDRVILIDFITTANLQSNLRDRCVAAFCADNNGADGDVEVVFEIRRSCDHQTADIVNTVSTAVYRNLEFLI